MMVRSPHHPHRDLARDLLRQIREEAKLTQGKLAKRLGTTQGWVSKMERSQRIDIVDLREICSACGVSVLEFVQRLEAAIREEEKKEKEKKKEKKA